MRKFKIIGMLLIVVAAAFMLCSCGKSDGRVYGSAKVNEFIKNECPNESYKLISKEKISDDPTHYQYKYETPRGIIFTVNNCRAEQYFYALPIWKKSLTCDYRSIIMDMYRDDALEVISQYDKYDPNSSWVYVDTYADIEPLVDQIMKAEAVFEPELEYNDKYFLSTLECARLHIVHFPSDEARENHDDWVNLLSLYINGGNDRDYLLDALETSYLQKVKVGTINDATVTREMTDQIHLFTVDNLMLDGNPMKYEINKYGDINCGLISDMYAFAYYDENLDTYVMPCDIAVNFENQSIPLIVNEYATALGGTYSFTSTADKSKTVYKNTATWEIQGNVWEMKTKFISEKGVQSFEITKNGKKLDINYLTYDENERLHNTFMVGIPMDDFVKLFDLDYSIDEYANTVYFTSK